MTPADIIATSHVPNTHSVFFLGCFEKRVTLYSQQVRALNLVAAILHQRMIRENGRVAIVGAGAAGITVAVAFAKAAAGLQAIDVYETKSEVLFLQQSSGRYLHPHNYDWPAATASNPVAGLPILNWTAGAARDVQAHLLHQFDEVKDASPIQLFADSTVTKVTPFKFSMARVDATGHAGFSRDYDVVILAIGFGLERSVGTDTPSYWRSTGLEEGFVTHDPVEIFISGNGDGGLVDFMTAAFNGLTHPQICEFLTAQDFGPGRALLEAIEHTAWAPGSTLDIFQAYNDQIIPIVPPAVIANVRDRLRDDARVALHTNEPQLFKRETAVLNRLGCALVLATDEQTHRNLLTTVVGVEFDGPPPMTGEVRLVGRPPFIPWKRFLRLGPDALRNFQPFQELVDALPDAAKTPAPGYRPATPELIDAARDLFGHLVSPAAPPPPTVAPIGAGEVPPVRLRIDVQGPGALKVSGDLLPADLGHAWRGSAPVVVDCAVGPQDAPKLVAVFARLCGHASTSLIHGRDRRRWEDTLRTGAAPRTLPGNLDFQFRVEEARMLPAIEKATAMNADDLAAAIHTSLDAETFRGLHGLLYDVLGRSEPEASGWEIEPELRQALWQLWEQWYPQLEADSGVRRRFLLLLAHERDYEADTEEALVRVGPRTLRPHLLKATIFALAFVAGTGRAIAPAVNHPGNIRGEALSGHACGVAWIEGREVGPRTVVRPWSTPIVLLSELKAVIEILRDEPRLDVTGFERPRVGDVAEVDRPLILGADDRWLEALEQGAPALSAYIQDVLDWRAELATEQIEGEA